VSKLVTFVDSVSLMMRLQEEQRCEKHYDDVVGSQQVSVVDLSLDHHPLCFHMLLQRFLALVLWLQVHFLPSGWQVLHTTTTPKELVDCQNRYPEMSKQCNQVHTN
jgi:hypothetical protein